MVASAPTGEPHTLLGKKHLINVSTQNNFCGYYVLARRILNDGDLEPALVEHFDQFYQTNWTAVQLTRVLQNLCVEQAEIVLGLVLRAHYGTTEDGVKTGALEQEGLDLEGLDGLCKAFRYDLSLLQWKERTLQTSLDPLEFVSLSRPEQNKEIKVLFHHSGAADTMGHYYLVELDADKVALDARFRGQSDQEYTYAINNQGSDTEDFIKNIKESIGKIDQQINSLACQVEAIHGHDNDGILVVQDSSSPTVLGVVREESLEMEKNEHMAWGFAVEEAERVGRKLQRENCSLHEALQSFKRFIEHKTISTDTLAAREQGKEHVRALQASEFQRIASSWTRDRR